MFAAENSISWVGVAAAMIGIGAVLLASGLLVISLARRGADGRLGRNGWAGVRTSATRSSDGAWRVAHETAERPTIVAGWLLVATGPIAAAIGALAGWGDADRTMAVWGTVMGIVAIVATVFAGKGAWDGHRAAVAFRAAHPDA